MQELTAEQKLLSLNLSRKRTLVSAVYLQSDRNRWQTDPLAYFEERLGIKRECFDWLLLPEFQNHKWDGTVNPLKSILDSLVKWEWIGVESGTGTGKTFLGACIAFWFLECFSNSVVVTTAPKQDQLSLHLWKEIAKLHGKFGMGELLTLELRIGKVDWFAVGFVAGVRAEEQDISASKAKGFHAKDMLVILEETTGIHQAIINAFQDTCTAPHNLILAFGNPDHQLDTLHRFCSLEKVKHVRISAFDHPNVVLKNPNFIPGAVTVESIREKESRYGLDNPMYQSRVRGISPAQSFDSVIKLEWCYASLKVKEEGEDQVLAVDVANSVDGDKAAEAYGIGNQLLRLDAYQCPDSNQLGHRVAVLVKEQKITNVAIDGIGVGAGTVNALKEHDISVDDLTGGPTDSGDVEQFNSLRSQMWWKMREDLRQGKIKLLQDEELFADLVSPKWTTKLGKICVEPKEQIKKRLGRSPNKGDAVVYWNWKRQVGEFAVVFEA